MELKKNIGELFIYMTEIEFVNFIISEAYTV